MSKTVWSHKKWFPREEITFLLQVGICCILPYNQIIKRNNQSNNENEYSNIQNNNCMNQSNVGMHRQ